MRLMVILFMAFSLCYASDKTLYENYYNNFFVGERKTAQYTGPLDPSHKFSKVKSENIFLDDSFFEESLANRLEVSAFELASFWNNKILEQSTCPDDELSEHAEYIRYAFRLLTISYLYESIKNNYQIASELGLGKTECSNKYQDLFSECKSKSNDMKKFQERIYAKFHNEIEKIKFNEMSKKEVESWMNVFKMSSTNTSDPTFFRLQLWGQKQNKKISEFKTEDIRNGINSFCQEDTTIIKKLCSEEDDLFGISNAKIAQDLIKKSNVFNLINNKGMGEFCLNRFVKLNRNKEFNYKNLEVLFPSILKSLENEKASYLQGALFMPGALKEFDIKGLSDFLAALKPPKKKEPVKVADVKKVEVKVEKKTEQKKIEIAPVKEELIADVPAPKIKEFERGVEEIKSGKKETVLLDMEKFKKDYEFTSKMFSKFSIQLKRFQTRQALTDMRDYDKLGSKDAPFGIIFVKFLIDTDNHQGLYNIISIIGDKFYIQNDFDGINVPVFAQLKNDDTTMHKWQLVLMKDLPGKK